MFFNHNISIALDLTIQTIHSLSRQINLWSAVNFDISSMRGDGMKLRIIIENFTVLNPECSSIAEGPCALHACLCVLPTSAIDYVSLTRVLLYLLYFAMTSSTERLAVILPPFNMTSSYSDLDTREPTAVVVGLLFPKSCCCCSTADELGSLKE